MYKLLEDDTVDVMAIYKTLVLKRDVILVYKGY